MPENKRIPLTDFGREVAHFCLDYNISKKQLAGEAGVKYNTLLKAIKGQRNDAAIRAALAPVMAAYASKGRKAS